MPVEAMSDCLVLFSTLTSFLDKERAWHVRQWQGPDKGDACDKSSRSDGHEADNDEDADLAMLL